MFPFKQMGNCGDDDDDDDELPFQSSRDQPEREQQEEEQQVPEQQQDLIHDNELLAAVNIYRGGAASMRVPPQLPIPPPPEVRSRGRGRGRGGSGRGRGRGEEEKDRRRVQHREIERQRRQEMTSLFSTLRSLLPLHYLKGKRSMSDHIAESAKYIKQLEGRIKELGDRRDQLLLLRSSSSSRRQSTTATSNVEVFEGGAGGLIHVQMISSQGGPIVLSTSLKVLLQAGLDVVSCVTNKLSGSGGPLLHNIHCHVTDVAWNEMDVQQLKHRLYQLVSSNPTPS